MCKLCIPFFVHLSPGCGLGRRERGDPVLLRPADLALGEVDGHVLVLA